MLIKPPQPKGKLDTVTVNGPEDVPEWDAIDWRVHEGNVGRLRRRIFKATREQDWAQARSLQKMMVRHEARVSRMGVKDRHRLIVVAVG
jgi:DNA-binding GntR family transcriptional regulator